MAFLEGANDGVFNGVTEVELVAAPAASVRRVVKNINIFNADTAAVVVTVKFKNSGTYRQIARVELQVDERLVLGEDDFYVLDATTKSIVAVLAGAPATTNPDFVACWADAS